MKNWRETTAERSVRVTQDPVEGLHRVRENYALVGPSGQAFAANSPSQCDALWSELSELEPDPQLLARNRIVALHRSNPAHATFDVMRTKLLHTLRQNNWTSVAITSPTPGCGKSTVALNLAFSLAHQKDCRTIIIDLDLRRPQMRRSLGIEDAPCMEQFLNGHIDIKSLLVRYGNNLAVGANRYPVGFASELLQSNRTIEVFEDMARKLNPDVVIFDLPPLLCGDDAMAFLPSVDCAIMVVAAGSTKTSDMDVCEEDISSKTNMLGVVLNKCWYAPASYGYPA